MASACILIFPLSVFLFPSCSGSAGGDAFALFYEAKTKKARQVVAEISCEVITLCAEVPKPVERSCTAGIDYPS